MNSRFLLMLCLLLVFQGLASARMSIGACSMAGGQHHEMASAGSKSTMHDQHHETTATESALILHTQQADKTDLAMNCCDPVVIELVETVGCDNHAACGACAATAMPSSLPGPTMQRSTSLLLPTSPTHPSQAQSVVWRPPISG